MQADEEVGKISQGAPVVICTAMLVYIVAVRNQLAASTSAGKLSEGLGGTFRDRRSWHSTSIAAGWSHVRADAWTSQCCFHQLPMTVQEGCHQQAPPV